MLNFVLNLIQYPIYLQNCPYSYYYLPPSLPGLKELNLAGLDPVFVPELLLNYENGDIEGKMIIRDSNTHGLSTIKVLDVRSKMDHPEKFEMEIDYYLPKVRTSGTYKMEGLIGEFPIQGKGFYQVTLLMYYISRQPLSQNR